MGEADDAGGTLADGDPVADAVLLREAGCALASGGFWFLGAIGDV